ncbi:PrgH/EprH family type III secretion apparatus protein [Lelliottia sp. WAP21]|uniref:PrgH/EprH family type III secretion apparatus protein n=1 Tax=Lelliottia sp. WAP21 TaxID=2877426 RepID=UPI001E52CA64|nr:PrgH/EprH family type III secretion apparatus protein [Lelliottia sp. WAP21]
MQAFVLKILSGPMFGVDVELPDENVHLFFCDSEEIEKNHAESIYQHAINTLLVPCAKGHNTRILLRLPPRQADDSDSITQVTAQVIPDDNRQTRYDTDEHITVEQPAEIIPVPLNEPVRIGHVVIALKPVCESWSNEVTQFYFPRSAHETDSITQASTLDKAETKQFPFFKLALCGILCITSAAALFMLFLPSEVATIKDTLSPIHPFISQNKNGEIFILTKTQPEALWSHNALRKSDLAANNITILAESAELMLMKKLLSEQVIPYFDIKFTKDFTVSLLLSQERSIRIPNIEKKIEQLLTGHFPYLKTIQIQRVSDGVVLANAGERLKSLGLYSQKAVTANHVTFSISGEVDDFQLGNLRRQVNEFYDQYGDEYVKFVVNLNEDPLRNRTFKTGADSYVVIPGNHWLYSDITTTR